jgi:hypothetical protein
MKQRIARLVYAGLLGLHPKRFVEHFGGEMLRVFDEAAESYGLAWLLVDAALSLFRQRILRQEDEAELAAAEVRFGLLAGTYPRVRPPHLTSGKLSAAFVLTLLSLFIFPVPIAMVKRHVVKSGLHVGVGAGNGFATRR